MPRLYTYALISFTANSRPRGLLGQNLLCVACVSTVAVEFNVHNILHIYLSNLWPLEPNFIMCTHCGQENVYGLIKVYFCFYFPFDIFRPCGLLDQDLLCAACITTVAIKSLCSGQSNFSFNILHSYVQTLWPLVPKSIMCGQCSMKKWKISDKPKNIYLISCPI